MTDPTKLFARDVRHGYPGGPDFLSIDSLELTPGQSVACTGPSGSGKTTLLELLAGLQAPRAGTAGMQLLQMKRPGRAQSQRLRLQHLGLVFQSFELLTALSALENVTLPLRLLQRATDDAYALALLEQVGIAHLAKRKPAHLSPGEKQRVAICRALVHRPRFVLADEPTANLDGESAERIWDLLLQDNPEHEVGLLCVTHDPQILPRFAEHWRMQDLKIHEPASAR